MKGVMIQLLYSLLTVCSILADVEVVVNGTVVVVVMVVVMVIMVVVTVVIGAVTVDILAAFVVMTLVVAEAEKKIL